MAEGLATFLRWTIGAFIVVPLLIGGTAALIAGIVEADGAALALGAVGIAVGFPLMQWLRRHE